MRANRPPGRKAAKPIAATPAILSSSSGRSKRWLKRLWLLCIAFALATLADIYLLVHFRPTLDYGQARAMAISIYVFFVGCELCGLAALLLWLYVRTRKKPPSV